MTELIQPVRGMNDVLPEEAYFWERLERAAARIFRAYGYRRIRIPVLERTELFSRSIGELTDIVEKEMYTFEDRNGDSLTMRPEATASVIRACLTHGLLHNQQQKLWCSGPMFRREKPQKGRYRQFHQLSVEAVGFAEADVDAELIAMSARLWRELGLSHVELQLNSLGTPAARAAYKAVLVEYFTRFEQDLDTDSRRRLERNPLRILDSKNPTMRDIVDGAPLLANYLDDESKLHFERVQSLLNDVGVEFSINPRLVRGLDYYSRTVFEWVTDQLGSQGAVCSGGRYDGLVSQLGGRDTPAVGWALGLERVIELMRIAHSGEPEGTADIYIVSAGDEARRAGFGYAEQLRTELPKMRVVLGLPSAGFKAQLRRADRTGAQYALIIGDEELANGQVGVKPLRSGDVQQSMTLAAFTALLLRTLERKP